VRIGAPAFVARIAADARVKAPAEGRAPVSREQYEELLKSVEGQIEKATKELEAAKAEKNPRVDVLAALLESYTRLRVRYQEEIKKLEAKEEQVPKKPVEPKEPEVDVKDLKIEIELK
jgi:hypothetical protein